LHGNKLIVVAVSAKKQRIQIYHVVIPAKAREYVFTGIALCVCVSVCDHDNYKDSGLIYTVKKIRKPTIVYILCITIMVMINRTHKIGEHDVPKCRNGPM